MAGTVSFTRDFLYDVHRSFIGEQIVVTWVSDASGNADIAIPKLRAWLTKAKTKPSATAPTDNYDVEILDPDGFDVLGGVLHDRDTATTEQIPTPNSGVAIVAEFNGDYTFSVSNAGNAKGGTCTLRFRWK